jgi:UDP-N-acetylmuramate dehydrogenase
VITSSGATGVTDSPAHDTPGDALPPILADQPIPTWFNVGGRADRLARPETVDQLRACLRLDPALRVLGDGANLLVADAGVRALVVRLDRGVFAQWRLEERADHALVHAGAGVNLPRLIHECVRLGLAGLEGLGGIPASVGGAVVMNAGGAFAEIGALVERVEVLERDGTLREYSREDLTFAYRSARIGPRDRGPGDADDVDETRGPIITRAVLRLARGEAGALRARLLEVMAYKKRTQPLAEHSAGCCFKNPTLPRDLPGLGPAGQRVSAGLLIDRAGCKGLRVGGAEVSAAHANFLTTAPGATAADVLALMRQVRARVREAFGVDLRPEVRIWGERL